MLAASALALVAAPGLSMAQGGSALYAVGGSGSRAKPVAKPKANKPDAAVAKAAAPKASTAKASTAKAGVPKAAIPKAAARKSADNKPVARRKTRSKTAARKSGSPIALNGRWQDSQCIPLTGATHRPPLYVKRQYEFIDSRKAWRLDAAVYGSDSCVINTRMLTYHGEGSFAVTGKSRVASNAYDASFKIDRWSATPDTREGVLTLLNGRCGSGDFEQGRSLDLSGTGCPTLGIRSIEQAPREIELVSVSGGKFFMGSRSFVPGLADDRSAQLSSHGLVRTP